MKKSWLIKIFVCIVIASAALQTVSAAPIEISKVSRNTYVQPTLQIRTLSGEQAFCEPFYRYLLTC